jgi:hypothetical protein
MLLAGIGVAASLGWLIGRLASDTWPRGLPLGVESRETFWQKTLPWPTGVQEDTEIAWHVPRDDPPSPPSVAFSSPLGQPTPPTRPQRRLTSR